MNRPYDFKPKGSRNKMLWLILLLLATISSLIVFLTFYGLNTGNFVIGVDQEAYNKNISISKSPGSQDNQKTLFVETHPIYPFDFVVLNSSLDKFTGIDGVAHEFKRNTVAITFYIINELDNLAYDLNYYINLKEIRPKSLSLRHLKILVVVDDEKHLYHNPAYNLVDYPEDYDVRPFLEGNRIVEGKLKTLKAGGEKKITLIIWYEGRQILEEDSLEAVKMHLVIEIDEIGDAND
ncbi:MAG: hypothetical protein GX149_01805 [Acholeplasmataceae bacterium]|jgi:hypothetical protein|nr:hypothetical protein [Acholeplasmataceae bacterium]